MSLAFFLPKSCEEADKNFKNNIDLLVKIGVDCSEYINRKQNILLEFSNELISVYHENSLQLSDLKDELYSNLSKQIGERESARVGRFFATNDEQSPESILAQIIDSEEYVFLNQASALPSCANEQYTKDRFRNYLMMGALSFLYSYTLLDNITENCPLSLLLVEENPDQFCLLLHLCSFENIIKKAQKVRAKIQFVLKPNQSDLHIEVLNKIFNETSLAFHGLRIFRSPLLSAKLSEVCSWFHAEDGVVNFVRGALGNDTDEINQLINGIWNSSSNRPLKLLTPQAIAADHPVLLTASGPSLDKQISWLKTNHQHYTIIAAGSSLGTLLKNNIHVDICILLEMATTVFKDLNDLAMAGYDSSKTILISSITVDPRVGDYFKDQIFFHRPLSAVFSLFESESFACLPQAGPQAVNAAFEAMIQLGVKKFLLLGCDFGSTSPETQRSAYAMGTSPRVLTQPIKGSYGKTVYTSPELSVTRQLFENMIRINDLQVSSLGEGAYIEGVNVKRDFSISTIHDEFSHAFDSNEFVSKMRHRETDINEVDIILSSSLVYLQDRIDQFRSTLLEYQEFSAEPVNKLCLFASWEDNKLSPSQKLVHRLSRFNMFFLMQPLYDSYAYNYHENVESMLGSLQQLSCIQAMLLNILSSKVKSGCRVAYDVDWLKRFILNQSPYSVS